MRIDTFYPIFRYGPVWNLVFHFVSYIYYPLYSSKDTLAYLFYTKTSPEGTILSFESRDGKFDILTGMSDISPFHVRPATR